MPPTTNTVTNATASKDEGLADHLRALVSAGQDNLAGVKDKLGDAKDVMVAKADSAAAALSRTIQAHPFAAIGVAFGIGYLVTRLLRR